jgi:hypothetical protein
MNGRNGLRLPERAFADRLQPDHFISIQRACFSLDILRFGLENKKDIFI